MFEKGTAIHSDRHADPRLHLLARVGNDDWRTWCGGGKARIATTVTQRRCPRCLALARNDLVELNVQADEPSALDWYLGRHPVGQR